MIKRHAVIKIVLGVLVLALALVAIYSAFKIITSFVTPHYNVTEDEDSKTVYKDGIAYFPRQDITSFMLVGVDRSGKVQASNAYNNDGAADMVAVAVFDHAAKSYSVLMINRDTMTQIPVIGVSGSPTGEIYGQLALSHTYGSGLEDSSENTKKAVSNLLGGVDIDYYMSMNMDAVSIVTDKVGGVTVDVTEDLSVVDPSIPMGKVTLTGSQAFAFVRGRQGVGDQLNLSRMNRQKQFMEGFVGAVTSSYTDELAMDIYNSVVDYVVSNCPVTTFTNMMKDCREYTLSDIITIKGENVQGEKYMEFHVDEKALETQVLDIFYSEKPEN